MHIDGRSLYITLILLLKFQFIMLLVVLLDLLPSLVRGGHMIVHQQLLDRPRLMQIHNDYYDYY